MKTSTPRAPRRIQQIAVRTVRLADKSPPKAFVELGYCMSRPDPLDDPCAYAATVSGPLPVDNPAQRIQHSLAPTANETEVLIRNQAPPTQRTTKGDPLLKLLATHNIEHLRSEFKVGEVNAVDYLAHRQEMAAVSAQERVAATPLRRVHEGPQGSTKKRQRLESHVTPNTTANSSMLLKTPADGDVSFDTVRSVLRLVDESLICTPKKSSVATPRVLRAQPVPSPSDKGPSFAYNSNAQLDKFGGLVNRQTSALPFGFARI